MFSYKMLIKKAQKLNKIIVFPEAGFSDRIIEAVKKITKEKIAKPILIGDESALVLRYKNLHDVTIINPKTSSLRGDFETLLFNLRKDKGMTLEQAKELVLDPFYFSALLLKEGFADGIVSGAEVSTAQSLKPALQLIKAKNEGEKITSAMVAYGKNKLTNNQPIVLADCALVEFPNDDELCVIAENAKKFAENIVGVEPRVAFLSYSTKGSAKGENVSCVESASKKFAEKNKHYSCDGEVQMDTAVSPRVAKIKAPNSPFAQKQANVFIFPDINSGNIGYKTIQNFGGLSIIGPITLGFKKPVNDLSRGATVKDIIGVTAITAIQSEGENK